METVQQRQLGIANTVLAESDQAEQTTPMFWSVCRWSERYNETKVAVPEDWQQVVGGSETTLKTLQLRMPNCRYTDFKVAVVLCCLKAQLWLVNGKFWLAIQCLLWLQYLLWIWMAWTVLDFDCISCFGL